MVIRLSEETGIKKIYSVFFKQDFPPDLILVLVWLTASIAAIYLSFPNETPVRVVLVIPVILVIPGYCLLTALFPKNGDIDLITRMVLSIGLSIVIVPLIGLGLNFTPWGIRLDPIVISLTIFTLVTVIVSHYQRAILPSEERFRMPFSEIAGALRKEFPTKGGKKVDQILNVVLALAILITIITAIYVMTVPREGETFTEFFILGENRTAASYPAKIIQGQDYSMYVGVGNHEYRDVNYTIETWMLLTEFDNVTNSSRILTMDPNDRLSVTLAHDETAIIPYNLSVKKSGYNRVEFLLFKDTVYGPELTGSDRINASYRELHLGVTVQ
jgi:uncharacterized membrane protein